MSGEISNLRVRGLLARLEDELIETPVKTTNIDMVDPLKDFSPKQLLAEAKKDYPQRKFYTKPKDNKTAIFYVADYADAVDRWFRRWFGDYEPLPEEIPKLKKVKK